jgi:hypothetical protein
MCVWDVVLRTVKGMQPYFRGGNETADLLAKKGTTLQNKQTSPNFETIKRLIKQD